MHGTTMVYGHLCSIYVVFLSKQTKGCPHSILGIHGYENDDKGKIW